MRYSQFLYTGLLLLLVGGGGLAALMFFTLPTLGPRWLFFFLLLLALTGVALPIVAFFHLRFPSKPPVDGSVLLREAMWIGIWGDVVAWLQLGRILTPAIVVFLGLGVLGIEFLIRLREKSRWSPRG